MSDAGEACYLVYVTSGSRQEALKIAHAAVTEKLAACANVMGEMTSVFRWKAETLEDPEISLLLKTRAGRLPALRARVEALHSYDCPCIVAVPIVDGHSPFLDWIREETAEEETQTA